MKIPSYSSNSENLLTSQTNAKPVEPTGLPVNTAAMAFLLQLLALSAVVFIHFTLASFGYALPMWSHFILQAGIAMMLSRYCAMAPWWHYIHGLFPILIGLMLVLALPKSFYLYGLMLTGAVFWTTFSTQVPYFPSSSSVHALLKELIPADRPAQVIDIGSGLGGLMMQLEREVDNAKFSGIEVAPLPWLFSVCRAKFTRSAAKFHYGDYRNLNFAAYDVIYAYLSPVAMPGLWQKAVSEMRSGSLLASYEFHVHGVPPTFTLAPDDHSPKLYVWRM